MKKKSHALRKRVLALVAALFLICLTAVPAFADDVQTVTINGAYYFTSGIVVSDYFTYNSTTPVKYSPVSGDFTVHRIEGDTAWGSTWSQFYVYYNVSSTLFSVNAISPSDISAGGAILSTDTLTQDSYTGAEFSAPTFYIVFNEYVVEYNSDLYRFLRDSKGAGTTATFVTPFNATDITDVIIGGFNGLITGLGSGVADYFETLFLAEGGGLTTFATVSLVLLGVGLSIGIARWIIHKVGQ